MTENISNPWNILPIKNAKSARNCTEVHLSNQNIETLGNFESFPNLEVVWLNNNKIRLINNLDNCFRIKHFYIENNCLTTLDGSIKKFKFLETLLAGNNNLRGLDKILKILFKLTNIERLSKFYKDLYGNPCAEEPYYRQKVIVTLPGLKIFDRHGKNHLEVTYAERQRAETVIAKLQETGSGKVFKNYKKFEPSTGEKDLEREVKTIKNKRYQLQQENDKLGTTTFAWEKYKEQPAPLASKVKTNSQYFGLCPENRVSEWEKNEIKKLFWNYDKDKSGFLDFDEMSQVLRDIKENKAGIGKVPVDDVPSIVEVMKTWDRNNDSKIQWREFRDGMNLFKWKLCDEDYLKQEIKNLYAKAKKEEMNGRNDSAKQLAMMAMRLEGLDTRTKPLIKESEPPEQAKFRTDTFFVYRFKEGLRDVGVKTIYNSSKPLDLSPHMVVLR